MTKRVHALDGPEMLKAKEDCIDEVLMMVVVVVVRKKKIRENNKNVPGVSKSHQKQDLPGRALFYLNVFMSFCSWAQFGIRHGPSPPSEKMVPKARSLERVPASRGKGSGVDKGTGQTHDNAKKPQKKKAALTVEVEEKLEIGK